MRKPAYLVALSILVLTLSVVDDGLACYRCKYSPSYFGFCRPGYDRGHGQCSEYVSDPWTGRTGCDIPVAWNCYQGGTIITEDAGSPPGIDDEEDPVLMGERGPCAWSDVASIRLV